MAERNVLRVTLEYPDINSLFRLPDVSPFSENFKEYSTTPGIEHIYNELHANPSLKRVEATILLPPEQITPNLEQQTREAIRRYCHARSWEMDQGERALRWRALRALAIAVAVFALYVMVERPLANSGSVFLNAIGEGLGIIIWVALWFPLDALVFGVLSYDIDSDSYRRASETRLTIKPARPPDPSKEERMQPPREPFMKKETSMKQRATGRPANNDLASDLDRGFSLPASWYTDPAILDLERERIFLRSWQYVGRTAQVAEVGDYFTALACDLPIVVVRGEDGLRAFVNVCRHRRHEVMSGAGNKKVLQCPYHAWTYGLDGCLRAAPRSEREEGFDKKDFPLLPVKVDTWGPWVFVNPDLGAAPLASFLGELPRIIAQSGLDPAELRFWHRNEWMGNANWKVMLENHLECYHCPTQHPGFSAVIDVDPDAYSLQPSEWFCSQVGPVRSTVLEGKSRKKIAYDARGAVTQSQYHFLWPNFTININPGYPNLSIDVWMPHGPERTRGFSEQYFGADVSEDFARDMMAFDDQVGAEDEALTDSVQRGLRAGLPVQGRFLVESERLVIHFQRLVLSALS